MESRYTVICVMFTETYNQIFKLLNILPASRSKPKISEEQLKEAHDITHSRLSEMRLVSVISSSLLFLKGADKSTLASMEKMQPNRKTPGETDFALVGRRYFWCSCCSKALKGIAARAKATGWEQIWHVQGMPRKPILLRTPLTQTFDEKSYFAKPKF